ncbi:adenine-specific DNA methylase containing a Zn-ribbon (plasmid) [Cylindrospermum stagnale PCC 7417]|uniref:Adenine-specific DNA methylase containing a Zn-ribbon n=1 Tax=Cylindrospermum stagnale PCC 7417 TaxID=56107 RepID=K9X8I1_9NOST|nr:DUF1156 domain-containing protein [Cylindrospermum stagnale]AFZ28381.1 adenine-specific DNA methylase containing a Zn-ribbon [Cylindrospermum stagnale PCC 7417]
MPKRPDVFIEKMMPVQVLNEQVNFEHGGNPFKGLHRWYSRKPLSFSRASVLASILPADITMQEFEYLLGLVPGKEVKLYKTPPNSVQIKKVQDYCEKVWGTRTPTILDAFAGGGSIPFEAARYGLNVLASDLNPVAVVTMKAAMEYPLKFGPDLQQDIDKWVKWVGDEAEKRLAEFFPSLPGETTQYYFWAHTVVCPNCESVVPLSPNWWLSRTSNYAGKGQARKITTDWYAVKPIPNPENKRVNFELISGRKGKGITIETTNGEYDPDTTITISRGVGKCPNCNSVIQDEAIKTYAQSKGLGHQLYAVAYRKGSGALEFRTPQEIDYEGIKKAELFLSEKKQEWELAGFIPIQEIPENTHRGPDMYLYGIYKWYEMFNARQLITLATYTKIIDDAKSLIQHEYEVSKVESILTYLSILISNCVDKNCRLAHLNASKCAIESALGQHSLNLFWNYPETNVITKLWQYQCESLISDYSGICNLFSNDYFNASIPNFEQKAHKYIQIKATSADSLTHVLDKSVDAIVTDPPYYDSIRYGEISDFFYVWLRANLLSVFPDLFFNELTDKDREAIANPGRFRNMGVSPEILANQDYEAKMAMAFAEYHRVLRDDGVMTVQFNHKDSGAWDVLAKSLIDAGFEITASWAVSTENPQNLHQAQKNAVSSTVLLVCRKRDPNAEQAWWDDVRIDVRNIVFEKAPELEKCLTEDSRPAADRVANPQRRIKPPGINLCLSAFGSALSVFTKYSSILDSAGNPVEPKAAFEEVRQAVVEYRLQKLLEGKDFNGIDPLTQWYILAWDTFEAREFPFDEARQLALAVGGFDVSDLVKKHKLLDSGSGYCKLLTPEQRLKKRAFSVTDTEFSARYLVDGLHAIIALYQEEENTEPVRRFMKNTGLVSNDLFMRTFEVALKVIPRIGDEKKRIPEEKALLDLWLAMDEIKAKVSYVQPEIPFNEGGQLNLF